VRHGSDTIYIVMSTAAFRDANCGSRKSLVKLASILIHEEYHVRYGPAERPAYEAQLGALTRLGVPPDSSLYIGVVRSMVAVAKVNKRREALARSVKQEGSLAAAEPAR